MNGIQIGLLMVGIHLAAGVPIAIAFAFRGAASVDPAVRDSSPAFRLLLIPASIALWPVVAARWAQAGSARGRAADDPEARRTENSRLLHRAAWPLAGVAAAAILSLAVAGRPAPPAAIETGRIPADPPQSMRPGRPVDAAPAVGPEPAGSTDIEARGGGR